MASKKSATRTRGKWWFEKSRDEKIQVMTGSGKLKDLGEELLNVIQVKESQSDQSKIKICFESNCQKGYARSITLFDFTANEYSKNFKNFLISTKSFCQRFNALNNVGSKANNIEQADITTVEIQSSCENNNVEVIATDALDNETSSPTAEDVVQPTTDNDNTPLSHNPKVPTVKRKNVDIIPVEDVDKSSPAKKKKNESESQKDSLNDEKFLKKMEVHLVPGIHKVKVSSLVNPREEYQLRAINKRYVEMMKKGIKDLPMASFKPLIVVAAGLKNIEDFDVEKLDSYDLEVLGGNHRRAALLELMEKEDSEYFKFVHVQIYAEIPSVEALRLANLHNRIDTMHHSISTKEKVQLSRNLFNFVFEGKKTSEWKNAVANVVGESINQLEVVYFLSSLEEDHYSCLTGILEKYEKLELKGQKATVKCLKSAFANCPAYKFKCLRGDLSSDELLKLLQKVYEKEMSLQEMDQEAKRIKEVREVQRYFMANTGCKSWHEAKERFPEWVAEDLLQSFRGMIRRNSHNIDQYVARALRWETSNQKQKGASLEVFGKNNVSVVVLEKDITQELNHIALRETVPLFQGASAIFMNVPKDMEVHRLEGILRNLRALNALKNIGAFHVVMFVGSPVKRLQEVAKITEGENFMVETAYLGFSNKKIEEGSSLNRTVQPFLITHSSKNGFKVALSDLFIFEEDKNQKVPQGLYEVLITAYAVPNTWILDLCSRSGVASKAALKLKYSAISMEASKTKVRDIRRNLYKSCNGTEAEGEEEEQEEKDQSDCTDL